MTPELGFSASDYASIVSINIFVALLSACIIIGHLLEENRWMNESVTAILIVSSFSALFSISLDMIRTVFACAINDLPVATSSIYHFFGAMIMDVKARLGIENF
jgi:hypothetical protein